jgi:Fe-S cluster assembly protein SufD
MKIFNDDVVCKHGTTIGSLDKDQIFYLKSRGLDKKSSENLLLKGIVKNYIPNNSLLNNFLPKAYQ